MIRSLTLVKRLFGTTSRYNLEADIPESMPRRHMNMMEAINSALDIALGTDPT